MIEDQYRARAPRSAALYARASRVLPAGLTHDSRATSPYPIYVARAAGARKWDVDGNEYVDYFGGHGALLFGDRKSTRLNSSHVAISYAVFCLKKKTNGMIALTQI